MFTFALPPRHRSARAWLRHGLLTLFLVCLALLSGGVQAQIISTFAGNGTEGFGGDGGPASAAILKQAYGVAVDSAGNLYIADSNNHRVRKVTVATGVISTVAGNGNVGFSGDGGSAIAAQLNYPTYVAVDSVGNLYISDTNNNRIRKVTAATGIITTFAGDGSGGSGGDGGPAAAAGVSSPSGLALDGSDNLYVSQYSAHRIRKITPAGTISTVAGTGSQGFSGDGGLATAAQLNGPYSVAADGPGNLYIADYANNRIRKVTVATGIISTFAGDGSNGSGGDGGLATAAGLYSPLGVALDSAGNMYIAQYFAQRVRKISPGGTISTVAGNGSTGFSGDGGLATAAMLNLPASVAVDSVGKLYFADYLNNRVRRVAVDMAPSAPTAVSGTAGNAEVLVSWTAPASNGSSPITGYTVTASSGATCTPVAAATSCTVTGLTNGTAYTFTVTAANAVGPGVASDPSASVTPFTVPGAPTAVSGTTGNAEVLVSWTPPASNGGSPITGYTVTANNGATCTATAAATSCTVTGLTNGTAYTFTVTAANAAGPGVASNPSASVTPVTVPGAPFGVTATAGRGSALVSWTAPASDGGSPITLYTVTAHPGGTVTAGLALMADPAGGGCTAVPPVTSCTVSGLTPGVPYTFTVVATNAVGSSLASEASASVTPLSTEVQPVPTLSQWALVLLAMMLGGVALRMRRHG